MTLLKMESHSNTEAEELQEPGNWVTWSHSYNIRRRTNGQKFRKRLDSMSNISSQCSMTSPNMRTFRTSNPRKEKAINNRNRIIREGIKKEVVVVKVNIEGEVKAEVRAEVRANDIVETEDVLNTSGSSSRHQCSATTTQPPFPTRPATEAVRCSATSFTTLTSLGRIA
jgi:hypothetical protein